MDRRAAAAFPLPPRRRVLGCPIDCVTLEGAVARIDQAIVCRETLQHVAINAAKVVRMQRERVLGDAAETCELSTADGTAVVWASRLLGHPLPERVAGIDLMEALFALAAKRGYGVYMLGARPEVLDAAAAAARKRHPELRVVGTQHGYFSPDEEAAVVEALAASKPDILFVALETPAKELFLNRLRSRAHVPFAMGVGGAFDVLAGNRRRAPVWMQQTGLEWVYRLLQDPRHLARRYAVGNTRFLWLVLRAAVQAR